MKHITNITKTKEVPFLGETVEVKQLSVGAIKRLQAQLADGEASMNNVDSLARIVKEGVVGAESMTTAEIEEYPMQELMSLCTEVMQYSGVTAQEGND